MSGFVQIIGYTTSRIDEVDALTEELRAEMKGDLLVRRIAETSDRDRPGHYMTIVEFDSYETAMKNSNNPTVAGFSKRMASLTDGPPTFYNLDVRASYETTD
ncbi:MAG: hypothetical protein WB770_06500 [Acidimicrobiales bacterium]